jgi:hypothetical protein
VLAGQNADAENGDAARAFVWPQAINAANASLLVVNRFCSDSDAVKFFQKNLDGSERFYYERREQGAS